MAFKPGQSGNPSGRPAVNPDVTLAARAHTAAALNVLARALRDSDARVRVVAANSILDRAWGKPAQTLTATVNRGATFLTYAQSVEMAEGIIEAGRRTTASSGGSGAVCDSEPAGLSTGESALHDS